jgi:hypothetical protein
LNAAETEMILMSFVSSYQHVLAIFAHASSTPLISVAIEGFGQEKSHLTGADIRLCSPTPGFRDLALLESLVEALAIQY